MVGLPLLTAHVLDSKLPCLPGKTDGERIEKRQQLARLFIAMHYCELPSFDFGGTKTACSRVPFEFVRAGMAPVTNRHSETSHREAEQGR